MGELNLNIIIYPFVAIVSIIGILLNKERSFFKLLAVILTILAMLRFDTGYDYYWYYAVSKVEFMNDFQIQRIYLELEPGIKKIVNLARYLNHPQYFFVITALITFGLIFYTIYRDSKSPLISLAFFMFLEMGFFRSNELVMQYCALAICFYSTKYAYEKKYLKYIFNMLIASIFFHNSSIICLFFIFIPRFKIPNYLWGIYTLICFIVFGKILPTITKIILPQYYYLFSFSDSTIYGFKDIKMCLLLIVFLLIIDFKIKNPILKFTQQEKYIIYQKNIFIMGSILAFSLAFFYKGHIAFRVGIYFMIFYLNMVGEYASYISKKLSKEIKILVILILNLWFLKGMLKSEKIILNKKPGYKEGKFISRPNSNGFKIFFGQNENNIDRYLPGSEEHKSK